MCTTLSFGIAQEQSKETQMKKRSTPLAVIFDTDMDSDVDDVAALCQLHALADGGEVEILAVMTSGRNENSGPCIAAINTFYGRPEIPIGLVSSERAILQNSTYAKEIAAEFPQDFKSDKAPKAVDLYRRILASRADKSVAIISVGDLTNLAGLLSSKADAASTLDGRALIEAKVTEYFCMGSRYPAETDPGTNRWGNFRTDPQSVREVVAGWPTMITFTGGGKFADSMAIGSKITDLDPKVWPVSRGFQLYFQKSKLGPTRHSADLITVLVAVRGFDPYFKIVDVGHNEIDEIGRNAWKTEPDSPNQRYTSELNDPSQARMLAALMEEQATAVPKAGLPAAHK
ncbi:MAG: nucleoside hydrolase [Candidatus Methylacidiphilales bacterium]|nr:nucleoside hydrolase [Candidatus Methylacidiphilales bacterium]